MSRVVARLLLAFSAGKLTTLSVVTFSTKCWGLIATNLCHVATWCLPYCLPNCQYTNTYKIAGTQHNRSIIKCALSHFSIRPTINFRFIRRTAVRRADVRVRFSRFVGLTMLSITLLAPPAAQQSTMSIPWMSSSTIAPAFQEKVIIQESGNDGEDGKKSMKKRLNTIRCAGWFIKRLRERPTYTANHKKDYSCFKWFFSLKKWLFNISFVRNRKSVIKWSECHKSHGFSSSTLDFMIEIR